MAQQMGMVCSPPPLECEGEQSDGAANGDGVPPAPSSVRGSKPMAQQMGMVCPPLP
ncbi:hypothetical protein LMG32289_02407 [Cupriavidus pampae]|uniref:Uncharacterized protein n=1 Tax=Cupriavidus pampae TaxID=659251 RepID=A0ABM8WVK2_9BURK|nr:hypothetical protein LMG32289_02407 [Cupriavidus pampae]